MRKLIYVTVFSLLFLLTACSSKELDIKNTEKRDGFVYEKGQEKPFSGIITNHVDESMILEIEVKKGKYHGKLNLYNKDGELLLRKTYKNGELLKEEKFASDMEIMKNMFNNLLDSFKL